MHVFNQFCIKNRQNLFHTTFTFKDMMLAINELQCWKKIFIFCCLKLNKSHAHIFHITNDVKQLSYFEWWSKGKKILRWKKSNLKSTSKSWFSFFVILLFIEFHFIISSVGRLFCLVLKSSSEIRWKFVAEILSWGT